MYIYLLIEALQPAYLGVSSTENVNHDLHDRLMHAQSSHQVGMLVEHLVVHDITAEKGNFFNAKLLEVLDSKHFL